MCSQCFKPPGIIGTEPGDSRRGNEGGAEFVGKYFSRLGGEPREVMTVPRAGLYVFTSFQEVARIANERPALYILATALIDPSEQKVVRKYRPPG